MRAVGIKKFGGPEVLEILDVPKPSPKADEILIQIMASGVNPVDWKIRGGYLKDVLPHEFPVILKLEITFFHIPDYQLSHQEPMLNLLRYRLIKLL